MKDENVYCVLSEMKLIDNSFFAACFTFVIPNPWRDKATPLRCTLCRFILRNGEEVFYVEYCSGNKLAFDLPTICIFRNVILRRETSARLQGLPRCYLYFSYFHYNKYQREEMTLARFYGATMQYCPDLVSCHVSQFLDVIGLQRCLAILSTKTRSPFCLFSVLDSKVGDILRNSKL